MRQMVNTVTGPIDINQLGKTLIHEHFIFGYPGFQGDQTLGGFNRQEALEVGISVAMQLMSYGIRTVVDPTPNECGRNPELLREISEHTGLQIICATGYYYEGEGATPYFKFRQALGTAEQEIYEMFMKELTEGIGSTGIKPGIIKLASSKNEITAYEEMFFRAAARAHLETGVTILTHTQEGTMGPEQAQLLVSMGVAPNRIVIGHMCGNINPFYHKETLEYGVNIALDRFGIQGMVGTPFDTERIELLLKLLNDGYEDRIMLSHDTVNVWLGRPPVLPEPLVEIMANWHPTYLLESIIPQLREKGVSETTIDKLFLHNPKSLFMSQRAEKLT